MKVLNTLDELYPKNKAYEPIVSIEQQRAEIANLKHTIKYESFFFVFNLLERKLEHIHGVADWLGYSDNSFSLKHYLSIIHPNHLYGLNLSALSAFESANDTSIKLQFMKQKIVAQLPLRHANDIYYAVKRTLYPFQIDKSEKVLSYLNHFVILNEHNEFDPLEIRVGKETKLKSNEEETLFSKRQLKNLEKKDRVMKTFNLIEIKILKEIANDPTVTLKEVSENLNRNLTTLQKTDSKRMLVKGRELFGIDAFSNLKELALYMKRECLL